MRATSLAGYKYDDGTHVCINCAHDSNNKESLKGHGERDVMFFSEFVESKCPKCIICKTRMLDVIWRDTSKKDDSAEDSDKKKSTVKNKKNEDVTPKRRGRPAKDKPVEPVAKRGRGRPRKIKTELPFNDEPLSEPVIKRGRGRPKGSKNKIGVIK
jgi:hypothetical protein